MLDCAITYILLITEHNGDVSPDNGLGEVRQPSLIILGVFQLGF